MTGTALICNRSDTWKHVIAARRLLGSGARSLGRQMGEGLGLRRLAARHGRRRVGHHAIGHHHGHHGRKHSCIMRLLVLLV